MDTAVKKLGARGFHSRRVDDQLYTSFALQSGMMEPSFVYGQISEILHALVVDESHAMRWWYLRTLSVTATAWLPSLVPNLVEGRMTMAAASYGDSEFSISYAHEKNTACMRVAISGLENDFARFSEVFQPSARLFMHYMKIHRRSSCARSLSPHAGVVSILDEFDQIVIQGMPLVAEYWTVLNVRSV